MQEQGDHDTHTPGTATRHGSIFQFPRRSDTDSSWTKPRSEGRTSTPRNLVFPELGNDDVAADALPTAPVTLPLSARKYLEPESASASKPARTKPPRSLRGKLHFYLGDGRSTKQAVASLTLQQTIAYVLLLAALLSESATPAPRYNAPLGVLIFLLPVVAENGDAEALQRRHHRLFVSGLSLATGGDFVWLLRPQEGAFNGYFLARAQSFTHLCLAVCVLAKLSLLFSTYFTLVDTEPPLEDADEEHEHTSEVVETRVPIPPPSFRLWDELKHFFPRRTLPLRAQLSLEVLRRVLALAWLHLLFGLLLLLLGLVASAWYAGRTQFRARPLGVPLYVMLLIKAATTLLCYLTVAHRINYDACLQLYGLRAHKGATVIEVDGERLELPREPVLAYNRTWLRRVQRAKALDALTGGYLLLVFYAALRSGQFVGGRGVAAILAATALSQLVLDVWVPLLILVAARCGSALHALHRRGIPGTDPLFPPQLRWDDSDAEDVSSNDEGESDEVDDVSDDEGEGSEGDSSPHSSSSSGDADRTPAERRERRLRYRQERERRQHQRGSGSLLPIVDAHHVETAEAFRRASGIGSARGHAAGPLTSGRGAWVRHWHDESGRAYLVHSITGEAVWEIVKSAVPAPRHDDEGGSDGASDGDGEEEDSFGEPPLSPAEFAARWDELADGGGFTCRVSRIPSARALARHLRRQRFRVVSDGLRAHGVQQQRAVLFYAEGDSGSDAGVSVNGSASGRTDSGLLFLAEFAFDSLSLKLRACFRCAEPDEIVPFVKRLQLKRIVGAYAPCE